MGLTKSMACNADLISAAFCPDTIIAIDLVVSVSILCLTSLQMSNIKFRYIRELECKDIKTRQLV